MRYWAKKENGVIKAVESYSHDSVIPNLVEISETEFIHFITANTFPQINWKKEWGNAGADTNERLKVIAHKLGLE